MNQQKRILALLFILAITFRFIILANTINRQSSEGITVASIGFAENIAAGRGFSSTTNEGLKLNNNELPGYSLFLGGLIFAFGKTIGLFVARILQIIFSAFGVFLCFSIGSRLFNRRTGYIFAFLWALCPPEAYLSTHILHDAPMAILALLSLYFFICAVLDKKIKYYIYLGITLGLTNTIRSDLLLLPVFFFLVLLMRDWRFWKLHFKNTLIVFGIIFLFLLPWGIRNYIQFDEFRITRNAAWQGLWEGFGEFSNPFGAVLDDKITYQQVTKEYGRPINENDYQKILKAKALKAISENPLWYVKMIPKRFLKMAVIGGYGFWLHLLPDDPAYNYSSSYRLSNPNGSLFGYLMFLSGNIKELFIRLLPLIYKLLILLASFAALIMYRKEWRNIILILSVYAYGILSHLPIYWEPRYLISTEFPLLLLTALFFVRIYKKQPNPLQKHETYVAN